MDFIVAQAQEKGLAKITLTVNKENSSSIRFYEAMGFRAVLSVRQDIGSGFFMDDWRMEKQVS
jgi:diamine N-acetyltransferase